MKKKLQQSACRRFFHKKRKKDETHTLILLDLLLNRDNGKRNHTKYANITDAKEVFMMLLEKQEIIVYYGQTYFELSGLETALLMMSAKLNVEKDETDDIKNLVAIDQVLEIVKCLIKILYYYTNLKKEKTISGFWNYLDKRTKKIGNKFGSNWPYD